ncbi:MAG: glycine--tRNA ligase [Alphaproteobacteria bacterium]|nr:glycine--tRNA ligase [Alphaproteobacteria bacterium]
MIDMKDIVALCKRRGFIFAASDIYGGLNGFWDFGPLGVELKNNLRDQWWKSMVITPPLGLDGKPVQIVGLDSAIIQNPKAWIASGHVGGFSDPMVDCRETKKRYRADQIIVLVPKDTEGSWLAFEEGTDELLKRKKMVKFWGSNILNTATLLTKFDISDYDKIIAPDAKKAGTLTEPRQFNLMLDTYPGVVRDDAHKAYLRPETAQGIFLNFKNVVDSSRVRIPFGIAQIGKAFRNEVTPRNFIFRSREFEQMEMEWFCEPDEAKKWHEFWIEERKNWWRSMGLTSDNILMRPHDADELAHYAKEGLGTYDVEYKFPFTDPGFGELEGIAHRCDFDLKAHQEHSGQKLEYFDQPNNKRFIPHVIEPAAGLTRGVLALICEAYTIDETRPSGCYLNFLPALAPKKAAILPLTAKDEHVPIAQKLYMELREEFPVDLDIKQNIGKRYARQDEIGTPYCFTIDNDTLSDSTVTVRDRNTMKQERINLDNVAKYLREKIKPVS